MSPEHLLLVSLGSSPGVVLGLLDALRDVVPAVTQLWLVTTCDAGITGNLPTLYRQLNDSPFGAIRRRVVIADGVSDPNTLELHERMNEVLYRLVLQGHDWSMARPRGRRFSLGIAGGRKNISAALQQAATFFAVDGVYHLVYAGRDQDAPRTWPQVQSGRDRLFLVPTLRQRSPWHLLIPGPWRQRFPGVDLRHTSFPLDDDWSPTADLEPEWRAKPQTVHDHVPSLPRALDAIATEAALFASPEALAAGLGREFLQHDLRDLLAGLNDHPEVAALNVYREGLRQLADPAVDLTGQRLAWSELDRVLSQALTLAVGRRADGFAVPDRLEVEREVDPSAAGLLTPGFSDNLLVLALRNLLANVARYGSDKIARVALRHGAPDRVELEVRNRVSDEQADRLTALGDLRTLFEPGVKVGSGGTGLGLFTVRKVADRTRQVTLLTLCLEAALDATREFVITLSFACQCAATSPAGEVAVAIPETDRLLVFHLDSYDASRRHDPGAEESPLAPRSSWLAGHYVPFTDPAACAAALRRHQGPALLFLHENDRAGLVAQIDLTVELGRSNRWLILYSGGWTGWVDCELEQVQRFTGATLPVDLWRKRWAAMPWADLTGAGRPAAWLGPSYLPLGPLCQPVDDWAARALSRLLGGASLAAACSFDDVVRRVLLRRSVLVEQLDTENCRRRPAEVRRDQLLRAVDQLWLLEGLALSKAWVKTTARLGRARRVVEELVGRPPSAAKLADADRPRWSAAVEQLEDLCREPLGEA